MRSRLALLAAAVIAVAAAAFAVSRLLPPAAPGGAGTTALPAAPASYLGIYEKGPPVSYQPVATFTQAAGRQPNLVGYYGGRGEPFEVSFAATVRRHGAITLLQWDPTFASVPRIAAGGYDGYLRSFADRVRAFGGRDEPQLPSGLGAANSTRSTAWPSGSTMGTVLAGRMVVPRAPR